MVEVKHTPDDVRSFLARKTDTQLREALLRGRSEIETLDWLEQSEDMHGGGGNGPFPLSRSYETWSGRDYAYRRRMIESAIDDTQEEIARRAALNSPAQADGGAK